MFIVSLSVFCHILKNKNTIEQFYGLWEFELKQVARFEAQFIEVTDHPSSYINTTDITETTHRHTSSMYTWTQIKQMKRNVCRPVTLGFGFGLSTKSAGISIARFVNISGIDCSLSKYH